MKTFLIILVLFLIVLAVYTALKVRREKQLKASRRSLTVQQAQADLASFRKAQEPLTLQQDQGHTYSGGLRSAANPVRTGLVPAPKKADPKPAKKSYHNSSDDDGTAAYDYSPPTFGYVDYDSKPSYTDSSPSTYYSSPSPSSDSSSSSGYSGGSSSSSSDSGSSGGGD